MPLELIEIDVEPFIWGSIDEFYRIMSQCFDRLNSLIKAKNPKAPKQTIWIKKPDNQTIKLGYLKGPKSRGHSMFDDNTFDWLEADNEDNRQIRMFLLQQVVFLGCRDWDLYAQVPVSGAYEERKSCYFQFVCDNQHFLYKLWINPEQGYKAIDWSAWSK